MGNLCGGPADGKSEKKQGLTKEKNKLMNIETGKEAYKQSVELLSKIKRSVENQNIKNSLVSESYTL